MESDPARCDSSTGPARRLTNPEEDQDGPAQRTRLVARVSDHTTVAAVTKRSKAPGRRSHKITYEVSSFGPLPSDLIETISAIHAKALLSSNRHPGPTSSSLLKKIDLSGVNRRR